ncbi:MAG TPA: cell envelope biogenesis protein OmpA [Algoriphagus sp.]|jgi:chemotaxis protein MotB|uniref:OmpA/MotB family protein n=1 Tax=unclassified Algoriphagus TaxID=2641541 RepID=UPI000C3D977B|nr:MULTISPECIES: OmpA family protein [unclassified Algoriphagus]MAL15506.1 cell envelope biogenesis protein OmpA [Algoriphagus sp.]HAD51970.1 cell envelope biogenesis protein OmpA [Algoriphagus sp.]HAS57559.1 cell envelope biogenesis protein OmpA [Algoriphagus sp.]HCD89643.1 cell envelope biogenesis protein OmpA [Algoriphagus sp.]HCH43852.1 cell envelope biogenesis protein OmpA [Algoriphagus sp.]|tara:strand:- start:12608 stop:13453 length:846 start_codon:yes stop_codon:yes gene_type:complete
MKNSLILSGILSASVLVSCVSKKKYTELESNLFKTQTELAMTNQEKAELEEKMAAIEARVAEYNARINSLRDTNDALTQSNNSLYSIESGTVMSKNSKQKMAETLAKVDPDKLAQAKTLEDSVNLAVEYNLKQNITENTGGEEDDVEISIDKTVVMISVSDKLLFNTASYRINSKADPLLKKLAEVINAEPSLQVMIEGHTDPRTISNSVVQDNWDLSVKRATSIVRKLQNDFGVAPEKMIAAGRASYMPIVANDSKENMAINRRTRIVLIPDLDMFFAML